MCSSDLDELYEHNIIQLLVAPESLPSIVENMKKDVSEGYEVKAVRKDGSVFPKIGRASCRERV